MNTHCGYPPATGRAVHEGWRACWPSAEVGVSQRLHVRAGVEFVAGDETLIGEPLRFW